MGLRDNAHRRESYDAAEGAMGFLEHLDELRSRLIRSCIAIAAGMVVAYSFVDRIADFVLAPTLKVLPPGTSLQLTKPGEGFAFHLDLALIGGVLLASPCVLYQLWRFIAPGLHAKEKRLALPFVVMAVIGTLTGAVFSHYLLFPSLMSFFASFDSPAMKVGFRVEDTFTQYKNMLFAMIVVFQLPTIVFFLARLGVVTARFLWHRIQYAILIIFIAAAVLTPAPDPWNQTVLAAPMLVMYLISIVIAWAAAPRGRKPSAASNQLRLVVAASVFEQARRRR
jgi:sec-independent protein translocase protein TatC